MKNSGAPTTLTNMGSTRPPHRTVLCRRSAGGSELGPKPQGAGLTTKHSCLQSTCPRPGSPCPRPPRSTYPSGLGSNRTSCENPEPRCTESCPFPPTSCIRSHLCTFCCGYLSNVGIAPPNRELPGQRLHLSRFCVLGAWLTGGSRRRLSRKAPTIQMSI